MSAGACLAVIAGLTGCSLDFARLQSGDGGITRADGGARDGGARDGGDAARVDGGEGEFSLREVVVDGLVGSPESMSAAGSTSGAVVATAQRAINVIDVLTLTGAGCDIATASRTTRSFTSPGPLLATDLDGDPARVEVLVAHRDANLSVLSEHTDVEITHGLGRLAAIAAGDVDADGLDDVLVVEDGARAAVFRVANDGTLAPTSGSFSGSGFSYVDGLLADLDGDGNGDFLGLQSYPLERTITLSRGVGTGAFAGPQSGRVALRSARVVSGVIEAGGPRAVVVAGGNQLYVAVATADELSMRVLDTFWTEVGDVVLAELDGAPPAEIVVSEPNGLTVTRYAGGDLELVLQVPMASATLLEAVDVDHDGRDEIVVVREGELVVLTSSCP